mgnify:CR=1 FL=1
MTGPAFLDEGPLQRQGVAVRHQAELPHLQASHARAYSRLASQFSIVRFRIDRNWSATAPSTIRWS